MDQNIRQRPRAQCNKTKQQKKNGRKTHQVEGKFAEVDQIDFLVKVSVDTLVVT
jgi:hypothetical protein